MKNVVTLLLEVKKDVIAVEKCEALMEGLELGRTILMPVFLQKLKDLVRLSRWTDLSEAMTDTSGKHVLKGPEFVEQRQALHTTLFESSIQKFISNVKSDSDDVTFDKICRLAYSCGQAGVLPADYSDEVELLLDALNNGFVAERVVDNETRERSVKLLMEKKADKNYDGILKGCLIHTKMSLVATAIEKQSRRLSSGSSLKSCIAKMLPHLTILKSLTPESYTTSALNLVHQFLVKLVNAAVDPENEPAAGDIASFSDTVAKLATVVQEKVDHALDACVSLSKTLTEAASFVSSWVVYVNCTILIFEILFLLPSHQIVKAPVEVAILVFACVASPSQVYHN
jgi:hypothetical protein